jgi:peptidoglycan/LPS O-acetylase OafA/YrhL
MAFQYRPDIDGLRAFAVLAVVGFHAAPFRVPGGFIGVDIFFVISGYLITSILLRQADAGSLSLLRFYAGRCRRLVPALLVVLVATLALGAVLLSRDERLELAKHTMAGALFVSNIVLWWEAGYFDVEARFKPLLHLWSLGVEEQFYLVWPWLVLLVHRRLALVMLALLVLSFAANALLYQRAAAATFFLLPTRWWELMAGALLAHLASARAAPKPAVSHVLAGASAALMLYGTFWLSADHPYPGFNALFPVLGAALYIHAGPSAWLNRLLGAGPIVLIGLASYSIYLWHWPLLSFVHIAASGIPSVSARMTVVCISIVLALATWRFIERPARRLSPHLTHRVSALWLASGIGVLVAVATVAVVQPLWTSDVDTDAAIAARRQELSEKTFTAAFARYEACPKPRPLIENCYRAGGGQARVGLMGDSHAHALFPGLAEALNERGLTLMFAGNNGCAPMLDVVSYDASAWKHCLSGNPEVLQKMLEPAIEVVVLTARAPLYLSGRGLGPHENYEWHMEAALESERDLPRRDIYFNGMARAVDRLIAAGKRVVIMIDVPELGFRPQECVDRPLRSAVGAIRAPCAIGRAETMTRQSMHREAVSAIQRRHPTHVTVFDPADYLCDESLCYAMLRGHMVYRDDDHLSLFGSRMLGTLLRDSTIVPAMLQANSR